MKPKYCDLLPTPDLLTAKSVLCIQPHPDDMEIGAGGTLARLSKSGASIIYLTVTDGSVGTYDPEVKTEDLVKTRRFEAEKSGSLIGVKDFLWLDYPDGGTLPLEDVRTEITHVIREHRPEAVMVCDPWLPYEAHSDHTKTGLATAEACLLSGMPNFCPADLQEGLKPYSPKMVALYYTAYPNTFIDVTETWNIKLKAIDCHKSQFSGKKADKLKALLTARAESWSDDQDNRHIEALKVLSTDHLHIIEDTWHC